MKVQAVLVLVICVLALTSCNKMRRLAGLNDPPQVLPPVKVGNNPAAPADERPVVRTATGFVVSGVPGVKYPPPTPGKKIKYVGPSN